MSLNKIYETVVFITFLYSIYLLIYRKKSRQQFYLYIYLFTVLLIDILPVNFPQLIKTSRNLLFTTYIIFSIIYFGFVYHQNITARNFRILNCIILSVLVIINFWNFRYFSILQISFIPMISLPMSFIYLSISWYIFKLKNVNESKITEDLIFWISSGILIWSVFFIFRAIPMYFLQENDPELLSLVITAFSIINIITYLLFLIGLIRIKI